jgi:parallel beta-helix repeat protein
VDTHRSIAARVVSRRSVVFSSFLGTFLLPAIAAADCPASAVRYSSSSQRLYVSGPVSCTLTDLDALTSSTVLQRVSSTGLIWILRVNLYLEKGAALVLHGSAIGGDVNELRLRSNDSPTVGQVVAIRADHGTLDIASTRIYSWDEAAGTYDTRPESNGRAYIHVRSRLDADGVPRESRMDIADSDLGYLGYQASEAYGLVWKVYGSGEGLYDKVDVFGDVTNNRIHHNWFGAYTYGAYGMRWIGNELDHNHKYGLDPHDDSDSLVIVDNDIHDNGNHGFICSKRCDNLEIRGNRSWNNVGNGFMLHRLVVDSVMEDNDAWGNTDAGLAIFDSHHNVIRGNRFHANRRGIRLSVGSEDNLLEDNVIEDNTQYGLYLYKGEGDAPTFGDGHPKRNTFTGNRITGSPRALNLDTADENELIGNLFGPTTDPEGMVLRDGVGNVLAGNVIDAATVIHTKTSDLTAATTLITQTGFGAQAISPLTIDTSGTAKTIFLEPSTITYLTTLSTTVTPDGSTLTLSASSPRVVTPVYVYGRPASGTLKMMPTGSHSFRAQSTSGTLAVSFVVSKLTAGATYRVVKNGATWATLAATASGTLTFTDSVGTSSATYSVTQ